MQRRCSTTTTRSIIPYVIQVWSKTANTDLQNVLLRTWCLFLPKAFKRNMFEFKQATLSTAQNAIQKLASQFITLVRITACSVRLSMIYCPSIVSGTQIHYFHTWLPPLSSVKPWRTLCRAIVWPIYAHWVNIQRINCRHAAYSTAIVKKC